jgi:hypothetical protein
MNVTVAVASESGMCCCAFSPAGRAGARPSSAEACGPAGRDVEDLVSSGSTLNLLIELVMKNLPVGDSRVVQIVTFTPKPRFVKMLLTPTAEDPMKVNDAAVIATRFLIRPQLGLFASLLVTDIPDVKCWILGGEAPAFLRFEGPLYFMGPIWRIDWS